MRVTQNSIYKPNSVSIRISRVTCLRRLSCVSDFDEVIGSVMMKDCYRLSTFVHASFQRDVRVSFVYLFFNVIVNI